MATFNDLRKIDVSKHIEKKGRLSYLSWTYAVDQLLQLDTSATWEYKEPKMFGDSMMVFCSVTAFGKTMTAQLPVMNNMNKAVSNPDSFAVNTAMQRCLAKAIALHGIGLYIYAGEDLPEAEEPKSAKSVAQDTHDKLSEEAKEYVKSVAMDVLACLPDEEAMFDAYNAAKLKFDTDEQVAFWKYFDSKSRSSLKKIGEARRK